MISLKRKAAALVLALVVASLAQADVSVPAGATNVYRDQNHNRLGLYKVRSIYLGDASTHTMRLAAPASLAADSYDFVLPGADGTANQCLATDGAEALSWISVIRPSDNLSALSATTSLQLKGVISDETGSGALVFGTTPTIATPVIASLSSGSGTTTFNTTGAITVPNATDTLVGLATTDTLTNKTLTSPKLNENVAVTTTATKLNYLTSATGTTGTTSTNVVFSTSPTLVTPVLGAATATSINKVAITAPASSATLTIADGKTATVSNTLTFTGTDSSSAAFGTGGTVAYQGGTLAQFAATTSAELAGVLSNETGSGLAVFATTPTLTTPVLGVATATSVNKVAITAPATSATLTIADGKTATVSNTLTFTGTDTSSVNFGGGGVVAYVAGASGFTDQNRITASYNVLDADGYRKIIATTAPTQLTFSSQATNVVTFTASHGMLTGAPIYMDSTGVPPTGLTSGIVYYAIVTGATTAKFATSIANALAGTAVTISGNGSGTRTFTPGIAVVLPTAADNTDRVLVIKKAYSAAGMVALVPEAAGETIDGLVGTTLAGQYDSVTITAENSVWYMDQYFQSYTYLPPNAAGSALPTDFNDFSLRLTRSGNQVTVSGTVGLDGAIGTQIQISNAFPAAFWPPYEIFNVIRTQTANEYLVEGRVQTDGTIQFIAVDIDTSGLMANQNFAASDTFGFGFSYSVQ